jgi:hypothetical protein
MLELCKFVIIYFTNSKHNSVVIDKKRGNIKFLSFLFNGEETINSKGSSKKLEDIIIQWKSCRFGYLLIYAELELSTLTPSLSTPINSFHYDANCPQILFF